MPATLRINIKARNQREIMEFLALHRSNAWFFHRDLASGEGDVSFVMLPTDGLTVRLMRIRTGS